MIENIEARGGDFAFGRVLALFYIVAVLHRHPDQTAGRDSHRCKPRPFPSRSLVYSHLTNEVSEADQICPVGQLIPGRFVDMIGCVQAYNADH